MRCWIGCCSPKRASPHWPRIRAASRRCPTRSAPRSKARLLPNGLRLSRRRIPIGVIGVIYEARPNVTIDIATLALKTGNAVILRGGSETLRSNLALVDVIHAALDKVGLPAGAVQYIGNPDRALVGELLRLDEYVDMIIPRGGAGLHKLCQEQSTIPVITGGIGVCHLYVDASADLERALDVIENAKVQRPSVCNALDTVLVQPRHCRRVSAPARGTHGDGAASSCAPTPELWRSCRRNGGGAHCGCSRARRISTRSGWR